MLKAFAPVLTMLLLFAFKLEQCTARLVAAVMMIAVGVCMASYGEMALSLVGVVAMLVSVASEATRLVLTQHLLVGRNWHPIEAWVYLGPACCGWLFLQVRRRGPALGAGGLRWAPPPPPPPRSLPLAPAAAPRTARRSPEPATPDPPSHAAGVPLRAAVHGAERRAGHRRGAPGAVCRRQPDGLPAQRAGRAGGWPAPARRGARCPPRRLCNRECCNHRRPGAAAAPSTQLPAHQPTPSGRPALPSAPTGPPTPPPPPLCRRSSRPPPPSRSRCWAPSRTSRSCASASYFCTSWSPGCSWWGTQSASAASAGTTLSSCSRQGTWPSAARRAMQRAVH
jgi:hypothetical protein